MSSLAAYPPAPNWYSCYSSAVSDLGYYVYTSRNAIVVLNASDLTYVRDFTAATEKVVTIAVHKQLCFVAGEDRTIRVWNILDESLLMSIPGHESTVNVVQCIRSGSVIISGDKSGTIIIQQPFGQQRSESRKVSSEVTSIAPLNWHGKDYFAVGYANGMIMIEALQDDLSTTTEYQMIHLQDGIRALAWQNIHKARAARAWNEGEWPFLASSSRKTKSVVIWNVPEESRYAELKFPFPSANLTEQQKNTFFLELSWSPTKENLLYVSFVLGGIYPFEVQGKGVAPFVGTLKWTDRHKRSVFGIAWTDEGNSAITYSLDKQIIKWNVKKKDYSVRVTSHVSYPYSIDVPSWNPGEAIVGLGESNVKLWKFASTSATMEQHNFYDCEVLWRDLQGIIGQVKCHPSQDGLFFYSTEYGRVGVWNIDARKNQRFKSYHNVKTAPSISYVADMSQPLQDPDSQNMVISCGLDGAVYLHRISHPTRQAINLLDLLMDANPSWQSAKAIKLQTSYCTAAVDDSSRFLALGSTDGSIEVYRLDTLKIIYACYEGKSKVNYLAWGNAHCPSQYLLAAGHENGQCLIHDTNKINLDAVPETPVPESPARTIDLLEKEITSLAWSHHSDKACLAVTAKNGFILVWDINRYDPLSLFTQHSGMPLAVCWCRHDKDTLISGGEDRFLYMWKYTDFAYPGQLPSKSLRALEKEKIAATDITTASFKMNAKRSEPALAVSSPKKKKKPNPKPATSLFSRPSKDSKQIAHAKNCLILAAQLYNGNVANTIEYVKSRIPADIDPSEYQNYTNDAAELSDESFINVIVGDNNALRRALGIEARTARRSGFPNDGEFDLSLAIDVMRKHFETFDTSAESSSLGIDSWIALALSPMAGKQTWLKSMEEQAKKLESAEQPILAAACYLACSRAYDAVEVYRQAKLYQEAIAVARLWLPTQDTLINTLFAEWADALQIAEQDAAAALCFLQSKLTGSTRNAINMLSRRKSEQNLFWAACLAHIVKDSMFEEYLSKYLMALNERVAAKRIALSQHQAS